MISKSFRYFVTRLVFKNQRAVFPFLQQSVFDCLPCRNNLFRQFVEQVTLYNTFHWSCAKFGVIALVRKKSTASDSTCKTTSLSANCFFQIIQLQQHHFEFAPLSAV